MNKKERWAIKQARIGGLNSLQKIRMQQARMGRTPIHVRYNIAPTITDRICGVEIKEYRWSVVSHPLAGLSNPNRR